ARAATLIFAASFASLLLGARALEDGVGAWDWVALGLLVGIGTLAVLLLWPHYNLRFRFDRKICSPGMTSPVAYSHVPDIEAKLAEVTAAGATVEEPARDVGGGRLVANITDPDGNALGPLQDREVLRNGFEETGNEGHAKVRQEEVQGI